eukprot:UN20282
MTGKVNIKQLQNFLHDISMRRKIKNNLNDLTWLVYLKTNKDFENLGVDKIDYKIFQTLFGDSNQDYYFCWRHSMKWTVYR